MAYNSTNNNPKLEEIKYINWINTRMAELENNSSTECANSNQGETMITPNKEHIQIDHIGDNLTDGILLLKLFDKIHENCIEWSKIDKNANNKFKRIQNCSY